MSCRALLESTLSHYHRQPRKKNVVPHSGEHATSCEAASKVQRAGTIGDALVEGPATVSGSERLLLLDFFWLDLLDTQLDPRGLEKARDLQMATLVEKQFATPKPKSQVPRRCQVSNFKWVDEIKRGAYRSRSSCADLKKRYAEETNTFAPIPYEESHILLELKCLRNRWHTRSGDIRCAYLLGADPVTVRVTPSTSECHLNMSNTFMHGCRIKMQEQKLILRELQMLICANTSCFSLMATCTGEGRQAPTIDKRLRKLSLNNWFRKTVTSFCVAN